GNQSNNARFARRRRPPASWSSFQAEQGSSAAGGSQETLLSVFNFRDGDPLSPGPLGCLTCLNFVELFVEPFPMQQFLMGALLDQSATVEGENDIGPTNR